MVPSKLQIHERIMQTEEQILERVEENHDISTHRRAAKVGASQFVVHRSYMKKQGLHPYDVQKVQALEPADFPRRVT